MTIDNPEGPRSEAAEFLRPSVALRGDLRRPLGRSRATLDHRKREARLLLGKHGLAVEGLLRAPGARRSRHCGRGSGSNARLGADEAEIELAELQDLEDGRRSRAMLPLASACDLELCLAPTGRKVFEQLRRGGVQGLGQAADVYESRVALAELDLADVGAVETGELGQILLREPLLPPQPAHDRAELPEKAAVLAHPFIVWL
jgi:hypothetical protein